MPLYFFNFHYKDGQSDLDGVELAGDAEAWRQATLACGEMLQDLDGDFEPGPEWRLEVTDADAAPVFAIHFQGKWLRKPA